MRKIGATEFLILVYAALLPFSLFGPQKFGVNIKLCDFVFPFLIAAFLIEKRSSLLCELRRASVFFLFLPFICAGLISFFNSANITKSFLELIGFLYLPLLSITIVSVIDNSERFYRLIKVWLAVTGVVLFLGVVGFIAFFIARSAPGAQFVQYADLDKTFTVIPRLRATFHTPNTLFTYLHVGLCLAVAYLYNALQKKPFIKTKGLLTFIGIIFAGAFLTLSRRFSGLLLTLFLILRKFPRPKILKYLKHATLTLFVGFLLLASLAAIWQIFPVNFSLEEGARPKLSLNTKLSLHLLPHVVSLRMFARHPLIGNGLGTYSQVFRNFHSPENVMAKYDARAASAVGRLKDKTLSLDPHSMFLGALAETGAFGLSALIFFFIAFYRYVYAGIRSIAKSENKIIVYILSYGLTGFLLNAVTIDILTMRYFWILMALIIASISIHKNVDQAAER